MTAEAEEFLDLAARHSRVGSDPLPAEALDSAGIVDVVCLYQVADALSLEGQRSYRRILAVIAFASTALALAFLLYDEAEAWWLILVVGGMLACQALAVRVARKSRCHERYVQMRVLAEALRVEAYLCYGGAGACASELLPWSLREDLGWVSEVLRSWECANAGPYEAHDVRDCWVQEQRAYHMGAIARAQKQYAASQRVVRGALAATVALYVLTLAIELACGDWAMPAVMAIPNLGLWRAALKICLGGFSTATLFVGSYYDKLSLGRTLEDHRRMARFYTEAARRLEDEGQTAEALRHMAREELVENAAWYAYQQASAPEIVV